MECYYSKKNIVLIFDFLKFIIFDFPTARPLYMYIFYSGVVFILKKFIIPFNI